MKNKIIATILLIASIIFVINSINSLKIYSHIKKGNNLIKSEKFQEARDEYKKALSLKEDNNVKLNILKSFYTEKKYDEVIKTQIEEGFLKGNSYVYSGDKSPDKGKELYEKALEEYKLGMKKSDDINIKKNYELTLKKLEEMNNQQNQDKNKENQDKQNQDNKQNNQNDKQQNNSNSTKDKNKEQENNSQNQQNKENNNSKDKNEESSSNNQKNNNQDNKSKQDNEEKKNNNSQENDENQNSSNTEKNNPSDSSKQESTNAPQNIKNDAQNSNSPTPENIRDQEVRAILKRLEGNEKQSFKNNERVMNINTNNPSNRW